MAFFAWFKGKNYGNEIQKRLETSRNELKEFIEPQCGLLTKLVSSKVLTREERQEIDSKKSTSKQCDELLNCMQRKTPSECTKFIDALNGNEQKHVANYIQQEARRFERNHEHFLCWPLEPVHRNRITTNLETVSRSIDCERSGLLSHLFSSNCISSEQKEIIDKASALSTASTINEKLLMMLLRRSIRDYNVFLEFLKQSEEMSHLAGLFDVGNPQLLVTLSEPPTDHKGRPSRVYGVVMLNHFVYVVYYKFTKVEVFDSGDSYKKFKDIEVGGLTLPRDMVGSSLTSQLFIIDNDVVIRRVDLKTGVSDVFVKLDYKEARLSLVEYRLLVVTSCDSLLMYNINSGEVKTIPLKEDSTEHKVRRAIESHRDSFFVSHKQPGNYTVSEIDSEGRVIRVFNNEQQLTCVYLALDSVGRLLVADWNNSRIVLLDEHLQFERILIDNERLDNKRPYRLNYNKNNNRLAVGLLNGQVKIFECYCG